MIKRKKMRITSVPDLSRCKECHGQITIFKNLVINQCKLFKLCFPVAFLLQNKNEKMN